MLFRPEPQQICSACQEEQFDEVRYRTLRDEQSGMETDAQPESQAHLDHAKIGKFWISRCRKNCSNKLGYLLC